MSSDSGMKGVDKFKGTSWSECETFIQAIREKGWNEGKLRDPAWMADFASLHFSSTALKWHSFLPLDVRHDWHKLEMALIERWGGPDDGETQEKVPIIPTPASAFSARAEVKNALSSGVLKFIRHDGGKDLYIGAPTPGKSGDCSLTSIDSALRFRYDQNSSNPLRILESRTDSSYFWLALHWNPETDGEAVEWAKLTLVDASDLKSSRHDTGIVQVMVWDIDPSGGVTPTRKVDDQRSSLSIFYYREIGEFLCITGDPSAYSKEYPSEPQGRFVFQWMD